MKSADLVKARGNLSHSGLGAKAITPGTALLSESQALYVGTGGDAVITLASGERVTFKNLVSGSVYPLSVMQIDTSGTTATDLIALY
jgi:hypothetical protein